MKIPTVKIFALGFLGAMTFHWIHSQFFRSAQAVNKSTVNATSIRLVDQHGKVRAELGFSQEGPPGFWMYDEKGVPRIVMGLYSDGSPEFGLQDKNGQMTQLLRSYGPQEAPLHIFKHAGQDKMIQGLDPATTTPFEMYYEPNRTRTIHFGTYNGP